MKCMCQIWVLRPGSLYPWLPAHERRLSNSQAIAMCTCLLSWQTQIWSRSIRNNTVAFSCQLVCSTLWQWWTLKMTTDEFLAMMGKQTTCMRNTIITESTRYKVSSSVRGACHQITISQWCIPAAGKAHYHSKRHIHFVTMEYNRESGRKTWYQTW